MLLAGVRGQPTRLSRNYPTRNGGKFGEKSFYMFTFLKDVSWQRCFFLRFKPSFCTRLPFHYFAVYSVSGSLRSKPQRQRVMGGGGGGGGHPTTVFPQMLLNAVLGYLEYF